MPLSPRGGEHLPETGEAVRLSGDLASRNRRGEGFFGAVIKVDLFAKLLDITTHGISTERHPDGFLDADLREGMVHVLQVYKVDHVAWPRPCFCNPKIRDVVKA